MACLRWQAKGYIPVSYTHLKKLHVKQDVEHDYMPFGDGHAAKKVVNIISGMENKK